MYDLPLSLDHGIRTVHLYGKLAKTFGKVLTIRVTSVAKALRMLEAHFPNRFFKMLNEGEYFVWRKNGENILTPEDILLETSDTELHIMPKTKGSGKGGLMAILGAILVGVAVFATGGLAAGGFAAAFSGMQGTIWGTVAQLGVGMMISGVSALMSPMPKLDANAGQEKKPSYIYSGVLNLEHEGSAIPVIYGKPIVGSVVISGGIAVENI